MSDIESSDNQWAQECLAAGFRAMREASENHRHRLSSASTADVVEREIRHSEWLKAVAATPEDLLVSPVIQAAIVCRSDLRKRIRDLRGTGRSIKILQSDLRPGFPYDDPHELEWRLNQFLLGSGLRFKRTELHHNPAWKLCRE